MKAWLTVPACICGLLLSLNAADDSLLEELNQQNAQLELGFMHGKVVVNRVRSDEPTSLLMALVKRLNHLEALELNEINDERMAKCLENLGDLGDLKELKLSGNKVEDRAMRSVASLTNLESLVLDGVRIGTAGLAQVSALRSLKRLEVANLLKIDKAGCAPIAELKKLEYFQAYGDYEEGALSILAALPHLKHVVVGGLGMKEKLQELSKCAAVERITIFHGKVDDQTVAVLQNFRALSWLSLERCQLTATAIKGLGELPLKVLDCSGMSAEIMSELTRSMPRGANGDLRVWRWQMQK